MSELTNDIPIACAPLALSAAERARSRELREMLAKATRQTREHEDGYSSRYADDREVFQRAAEWIVLEHLCCLFLSVELSRERGTEAPWLRVRGPQGTKEFLQAEMPEVPVSGRRGDLQRLSHVWLGTQGDPGLRSFLIQDGSRRRRRLPVQVRGPRFAPSA